MLDIFVGLAIGVLSSMGFGGGSVLLLYLTLVKGVEHKAAAGTNLLFFLPCAILSTILYLKQKMIEWQTLWPLMLSSAVGAGIGSWIAMGIEVKIIRLGFGALLLIVGLKDLFSGVKSQHKIAK
jgi:uncharacterized membrane protein YfcA